MNTKWIAGTVVALSSMIVSALASADEKDQAEETSFSSYDLAPVKNALELTLGTGYAQGYGEIARGQPTLRDVSEAGGALQVGVGYRLLAHLTVGVYGSGAAFGRGSDVDPAADLWSATGGVQADWHILPARQVFNPWVSLGSGWRGYWVKSDAGTTSLQGWEIAKLQVGVDYRIDRNLAISPVIGADLSTFFTQETPSPGGFGNVTSPRVNTFLFGGLQGRFDINLGKGGSQVAAR